MPPCHPRPALGALLLPLVLPMAWAIALPSVPSSGVQGVALRVAQPHELSLVAQLQLDIFAEPLQEAPAVLPMLKGFFESSQRNARAGMLTRLTDELQKRVAKGSEILIAFDEDEDEGAVGEAAGGVIDASGQYIEPGRPCASHHKFEPHLSPPPRPPPTCVRHLYSRNRRLLGTVDLSIQEMQLPTHAVAGGLYLSHMAVAETARRRGIARALLRAASACAESRSEDCIYLHVEPANEAAISLYESSGYIKQADRAP